MASASANAQVLQTIEFALLLDMNFGQIAVGSAGGVVQLDGTSGNRVCDPSLVCMGTFGLSELQISGSDADVIVTYDPSFALNGPGTPILAEPNSPGGQGEVVHLSGGSAVVRFGATLHVNANQTPGQYQGVFHVTAEYY